MKFITTTTEARPLTLKDVAIDQFFVSTYGTLYQKVTEDKINKVASEDGKPLAGYTESVSPNKPISRICDFVTKIEF